MLARRQAFTLIELMIVISIMAIVMAGGIPAFLKALQKDKLRKAVADLVEGCSYARAQAILRGVPMEFVIRAEDGQLMVQQARSETSDSASGAEPQNIRSAGLDSSTFSARLHDDVAVRFLDVNFQDHMQSPEARVRFFPNGTSDEFTIVVFSEEGERKISLDLVTGLADVEVLR